MLVKLTYVLYAYKDTSLLLKSDKQEKMYSFNLAVYRIIFLEITTQTVLPF